MATFYDARGNIYAVASPDELRGLGLEVPTDAAQAAGEEPGRGGKHHRSDGLLVGPFQSSAPFDLLIVNTDGTLAERSGNGLTIFSQALSEQGLLSAQGSSLLRVHHDQPGGVSPVATVVEPAQVEGQPGFWLALGTPQFGPAAVAAFGTGDSELNGRPLSRVAPLVRLNDAWQHSQFVRVGNPHCVTLVETVSALPSNAQMLETLFGVGVDRDCLCSASGRRRALSGRDQSAVGDASGAGASAGAGVRAVPARWPARLGGSAGSTLARFGSKCREVPRRFAWWSRRVNCRVSTCLVLPGARSDRHDKTPLTRCSDSPLSLSGRCALVRPRCFLA